MIFVTLVMTVIIFTGAAFTTFLLLYDDNRDVIKVSLEAGVPETVEFESLAMIPGEIVTFETQLFSDISSKCTLDIAFEEHAEQAKNSNLKDFVVAAIHVNGEFLCEKPLAELLDGEVLTLDGCKLNKNDPFNITFTFIMPLDVGNEAQGADTIFNVVLTASNE